MPNKIFDQVSVQKPRMSAFDLSREQKLSFNMGKLIPTYFEEIVPGDQFRVDSEIMLRFAPMLSPVMHRINVFMHYFFVPNRLVWPQWEDFITGGREGTSTPTIPVVSVNDAWFKPADRLHDYLGLPSVPSGSGDSSVDVSALPFKAYQLIWNEYYRDPNLHPELDMDDLSAADLFKLRNRCWEKDYFTSALPWPQRGEEVGIPAEFDYLETTRVSDSASPEGAWDADIGDWDLRDGDAQGTHPTDAGLSSLRIENLADTIGVSINDLRTSSALQRFLEKQARGGYRYIETILNHFGVRSSDRRLQRPEYLGGGKQPVVVSEVLNTSATASEPQGEMAGHGISVGGTNTFQEQFEEHGYVFGIMSVMPKSAYQQGIPRTWTRETKEDFYWPEFANLGEQEVKNQEIYLLDGNEDVTRNDETFGYQQRYAEYKYGQSTVHGDFRNNLDFWHLGRKFQSLPALNQDFVEIQEASEDLDRIFAVQDEDHLWAQLFHKVRARRPMPYFADPSLG